MEQNEGGQEDGLKIALVNKVRLAAEVAKAAPEFADRAFDKLLDFLLHSDRTINTNVPESKQTPREPRASRRAPRVDPEALERINPILNAPPELVANHPDLPALDVRAKLYALLSIAHEDFQLDDLAIGEIRAIANDKFRLNIPDGTIRGTFSKAPATEIGRTAGPGGETMYRLLQPGEVYLRNARARLAARIQKADETS